MIPNTNNNPDLEKAAKELDEEFPGAEYDYSLHKFLIRKNFKKRIIKKILFHGFFYSAFTAGIYFLFRKYNISVFGSLIYGLTWFLAYIVFKPFPYILFDYNIPGLDDQIIKTRENINSISRPYDKPMEGK